MLVTSASEWMKDQKQATLMAPGKSFEVIQSPSGRAIFFSIGSDNSFYAAREVESSNTGWNRIELSATIPPSQTGGKVVAKTFSIAQNPDSLFFDLALVVTSGSSDRLYLSFGNENTDEAWNKIASNPGITWTSVPFDDDAHKAGNLEIDGAHLMNQPSPGDPIGTQICFVDIVRGTPQSNAQRLLDRYYVSSKRRPSWQLRTLPINLTAGSVLSSPGKPTSQIVGGMYTLGKIGEQAEVIFGPAFNAFDPSIPPSPVRFQVSNHTSSIATSLDITGSSALFVSTETGVSVFGATSQNEASTPVAILTLPVVQRASQLSAETSGGITALYGVSTRNELFYSTCAAGKETTPEAWSVPITLVADIQNFAFFVDKRAGNNTIFAHAVGKDMFQLTQDPVTKGWATRSIILPSTDLSKVIEFNSFTTRVLVQDSDQRNAGKQQLLIKANSPVGTYVNDVYRVLSPSTPVTAMTDSTGVVKLSQPTQDSVAVTYEVCLASDLHTVLKVDPAEKAKGKLAAVKSKADLDAAQVKQADGTLKPLIPSTVGDADRQAAITAILKLNEVATTLPSTPPKSSAAPSATDGQGQDVFRVAPSNNSNLVTTTSATITSDSTFHVSVGDLLRSMLYTAWNDLKSFALRIVNGIHEFVVQVGNTIYKAVLDCVSAVSHAVEWIFQKISVALEDLQKWLGFLFNWSDIVRTHKVVKNVVTTYALYGISRISNLQSAFTTTVEDLEDKLNSWAELPPQQKSLGDIDDSTLADHPAVKDPQTHYIHDKAAAHLEDAEAAIDAAGGDASGWKGVLDKLGDFASKEKDAIKDLIEEIKTQIIDPFRSLTITDIVKKLAAIIGKVVLETAKNVVNLTFDLIRSIGTALIEELNKPIQIPIISPLYKTIADEELSIMDLICLAAAVPATLLYKAVTGETPFADNSGTAALIGAKDFASLQQIITGDPKLYRRFTILSEFVAMAGLFFDVIASTLKLPQIEAGKPHEVPDKLKQVGIGVKLLIIMPAFLRPRSDSDAWYWKMEDIIINLAFIKTCIDASKIGEQDLYGTVSPYMDYAISATWLVPAVGKAIDSHNKSSGMSTLAASAAYDVAVMTGPIMWSPALDPETKLAVFAGANAIVMVCGVVRAMTAGFLQSDD